MELKEGYSRWRGIQRRSDLVKASVCFRRRQGATVVFFTEHSIDGFLSGCNEDFQQIIQKGVLEK